MHTTTKALILRGYGDLDGQDKSLVIYEEHIEKPFPNGESLKDVERRIDAVSYTHLDVYKRQIIHHVAVEKI